jgi:hypothetical protein
MESPRLNTSFLKAIKQPTFYISSKVLLFRIFAFFSLHISLLSISLLTFACSPTESIFDDHELAITVDAEVVESWITLSANPLKTNFTYAVMCDSKI